MPVQDVGMFFEGTLVSFPSSLVGFRGFHHVLGFIQDFFFYLYLQTVTCETGIEQVVHADDVHVEKQTFELLSANSAAIWRAL